MALITRLSRLFQADFHAVLDSIEEPELQLRQAVREMQQALEQDRQRLQLQRHELQQLDGRLAQYEPRLAGIDEELDLCLADDQDELARDLVRRKLVLEKQQQEYHERRQQLDEQSQQLARQVDEQAQQLLSMQQKLELLVTRDDGPMADTAATTDSIRPQEIEIALLREKKRRANA